MEIYGLKTNNNIQFRMRLSEILDNYNVPYFSESDPEDYGYQRNIEKLHIRRLSKYIKEKGANVTFPTPIILGVLIKDIDIVHTKDSGETTVRVKNGVKLNVVDGQHRLKALEQMVENIPGLSEIFLMCTLSIVDSREQEVDMFIDINSKAKRIKSDLALLAKNKIKVLNNRIDKETFYDFVKINTSYNLNLNKKSKWFNAIKFDFNSEEKSIGIVGINSFVDSISPIVKTILDFYFENNSKNYSIELGKELSFHLESLIFNSWEVISNKWPNCFNKALVEDDSREYAYYRKDFEIQKYAGYWPLHQILSDSIQCNTNLGDTVNKSLDNFEDKIFNSKIKDKDWEKGGTFSGRISKSGINQSAQDLINN